jgi:hypothetical protein
VAVDASMFGHLAATLDAKSAQKPSRPDAEGTASDGSAMDGSVTDGMATEGAPLEVADEQADNATAVAATIPMSERRIDMGCLRYPVWLSRDRTSRTVAPRRPGWATA